LVKLVGWPPWLSPSPNFKAHLARALAADRMIYHGDAPPTDEQFQFRLPLVFSTMLQKSQRKPFVSSGEMNLAVARSNA